MTAATYTRREAADVLGVSLDTIDRRLADGTFTRVKVGSRMVRIPAREVDALAKPRRRR